MGTCLCEFDECSEFVFDRLENQCPTGNAGPTCALNSYWDDSDDIEDMFVGNATQDTAMDHDVLALVKLMNRLVETRYRAEEILTGSVANMTTLPPLTTPTFTQPPQEDEPVANQTRRKRSYVPLSCPEVVRLMQDINDLVSYVRGKTFHRLSTIHRFCDYIFETDITSEDCDDDQKAELATEIADMTGLTNDLRQTIQDEIIAESVTEMDRIDQVMANYSIYLQDKEGESQAEFETRKEAEKDLQEKAIAARDEIPTTLQPFCECPTLKRRRRRQAPDLNSTTTDNEPVNNSTSDGNETTTTTLTTGPPTTTWPDTCWCPDDDDDEDDLNTNSTLLTTTTMIPETNSTAIVDNSTAATGRKRRSLRAIDDFDADRLHLRSKRAIKYRCNTTMILGLMFYDIYNNLGVLANKCCCADYPGELFLFTATIDEPWINALADPKDDLYKRWKKMVDQEVRFLFFNKKYSDLMVDKLLNSVEFVRFKKLKGRVAVEFEIHLNQPHWDNNRRIETAFEGLVEIYRNQSADERNVLGKRVQGKYVKRDYIIDDPPNTHVAKRIEIKEKVDNDDEGSGDVTEPPVIAPEDSLPILLLIAVPLGVLLLLCIPFFFALRSKACLCRQCC